MAQGYAGSGITVSGVFSGGNSNLGNTAGDTGVVGSRLVLVGSNNITLSGSTNGGSMTISIAGGAGGGSVNISAGTTSNNLTAVTFSNSNGVSFGLNASTITASVATSLTNMNVSAGTTSNNLSAITFSNSNGISFGLNASTLTASYTVPSTAGLLSNINVSAGTTSNNLSAITFSNSNGISFGLNASTVTASVATSLTAVNVSAGTTSNNLSAITFSNSNGISFGLNASTVTASYTVPSTAGLLSAVNVSAGTTSNNLSEMVFSNSNNVSFGLNGSTVTATATVASTQGSINLSAGTTSNLASAFTFSNSNGISFGLNASTVTASVATSLTAINVSAGTTSNNLSAVVFSNSNNVSFGLNGSTVTATITVPAQTNQTGGIYVTAQSTGQSSSSTYDLRTLSIVPDGIISAGWSAGSFRISATQSNQAFSAAGGSSAFQTLNFGDTNQVSFTNTNGSVGIASIKLSMFAVSNTTQSSNGTANHTALSFAGAGVASVGITNGSVVISVPSGGGGLTNVNLSAGTTSQNLSNFVFSDSNRVSFGLNGSTVTAKYALNFSAGTTSQDVSDQIVFSNSNNMSFGLNGSTITGSFDPINIGMSTNGNTAGTTGTFDGAGLQYIFAGGTNITLSQSSNASSVTLSIVGATEVTVSNYDFYGALNPNTNSTFAQNTIYLVPFDVPQWLSASRVNFFYSIAVTNQSTANQTGKAEYIFSFCIYTKDATNTTQLKSLVSNSFFISLSASSGTNFSATHPLQISNSTRVSTSQYGVNNATASNYPVNSIAGFRVVALPISSTLSPGRYWMAVANSTSSANASVAISATVFNVGFNNRAMRPFGTSSAASNASFYGYRGEGFGSYSASSGAFPAAIPLTSDSIRQGTADFAPVFNISGYVESTNWL